MQKKHESILNNLNDKIDKLKYLYESEIEKNKRSSEDNFQLNKKIKEQYNKINTLESENSSLKFALALASGENIQEAKNKIKNIVREIDKCISLLNN